MLERLNKKVKEDERGLTLVELLAVVVILAIVSAIAFVLIGNVISNSKKDAHISNAQQVISAVKLAEASGDATFDSDTDEVNALQLDTIGSLVDPWEKESYTTALVTKKDGEYSITLSPGAECEITDREEVDLQKGRSEICP